jgi:hypothetical protein
MKFLSSATHWGLVYLQPASFIRTKAKRSNTRLDTFLIRYMFMASVGLSPENRIVKLFLV